MNKVEVFEPAMCCATGVCGPTADPELLRMTSIVKESKNSTDTRILRRNLSQNPNAFVKNEIVKKELTNKGTDALPLTLINGELFCQGRYPTNEEIEEITDLSLTELQA